MSYPGQPQQPQQPFPGGGYPQQQGKGSTIGGIITAISAVVAGIFIFLPWASWDLGGASEDDAAAAMGLDSVPKSLFDFYGAEQDINDLAGTDDTIWQFAFFAMIIGVVLALVAGLVALAGKKGPLMISGVLGIIGAAGIGYAVIRAFSELEDPVSIGFGAIVAAIAGAGVLVGAIMSLAAANKAPQ